MWSQVVLSSGALTPQGTAGDVCRPCSHTGGGWRGLSVTRIWRCTRQTLHHSHPAPDVPKPEMVTPWRRPRKENAAEDWKGLNSRQKDLYEAAEDAGETTKLIISLASEGQDTVMFWEETRWSPGNRMYKKSHWTSSTRFLMSWTGLHWAFEISYELRWASW